MKSMMQTRNLRYLFLTLLVIACICALSACTHQHAMGEWIVDEEPTCKEAGTKHIACATCGEVMLTDSIPATGHTEGGWIVDTEPTCMAGGARHIACATCGAAVRSEQIAATGHTAGDWIVETAATQKTEGTKYRACTACGERVESQTIPCTGPMDSVALAAYVQERTVSMVIGGQTNGTGFFIDENGTLVTNFHVIDNVFYSSTPSIEVELSSGARYSLEYVVKFDPAYDLAVLKIDTKSMKTPYLPIAEEEAVTGTKVYACGAALGLIAGNFTDGQISSVSHRYGLADSYISNTAISGGNSGGPLVNAYGEVLGVSTAGYTYGENLNIFLKMSNLENLRVTGNKTFSDLMQWFSFETRDALNKFVYDDGYTGSYYNSFIHAYHDEVGATCLYSSDEFLDYWGHDTGYNSMMYYYTYEYDKDEYAQYAAYLKSEGYNYDESLSGDEGNGVYIDVYYNDVDDSYIEFVTYTWNGQRLLQLDMFVFS
ncbi:MAG: trypsin-like peptidase domain-containing protein [Clostridia bacterium]|nr:trypsin-like peptidase domain-containing protein [Clostridia bacterium]